MNIRLLLLASTLVLLVAFIAGCGGSNPMATNSGGTGNSLPATTFSSSFKITIPGSSSRSAASVQHAARPNFISENTQSLTISINGGPATIFNLTATSEGCSQPGGAGTPISCLENIQTPAGTNEAWVFNMFSGTNGTGSLLAAASDAISVTGPGFLGTFTLNGVVSSYTLAWSNGAPKLTAGTTATATLNLVVKDASGAVILAPGSYADAKGNAVTFTLADDLSSHGTPFATTTLSYGFDKTNVTAPDGTASPSNAFTFTYGGLSIPGSTITITDSSNIQGAGAALTLPATLGSPSATTACTLPDTCSNSTGTVANLKNGAISEDYGDTVTITAAEAGWTTAPYNQTFAESDDCNSGPTTIIIANPSANQWTVTGGGNGVGLCTITLQDNTALGTAGQTTLQFTVHANGS